MSHSFTDSADRRWTIDLTYGVMEKIKDHTGHDPLDLSEENIDGLTQIFFFKPRKMIELLYVCLEDQIEEEGVTPQSFGSKLKPVDFRKGRDAFVEAWKDFFLQTGCDGGATMIDKGLEMCRIQVEEIANSDVSEVMRKMLRETLQSQDPSSEIKSGNEQVSSA